MTPEETKKLYQFCCSAWRQNPQTEELRAWSAIFGSEPDPKLVFAAATRLARITKWFPKPAELLEEAQIISGTKLPGVDEAAGAYMSGDWSAHPLIEQVARTCHWHHVNALDKAHWEFRSRYAAALREQNEAQLAPVREQLGLAPTTRTELAAPERRLELVAAAVEDDMPPLPDPETTPSFDELREQWRKEREMRRGAYRAPVSEEVPW